MVDKIVERERKVTPMKTSAAEPRYQVNPELAWRLIEDEAVILKIKTTTYYSLNPVGTVIFRAMGSEPRTREELLETVLGEFDVDVDTARNDLEELLQDLLKEELVIEVKA
ncbi:MAG: PqqD family protein [Candidatus Hydrogenedentota bacterium]|nr:MAG: PqqD family protein [Candidatus Hydrogenedentota bacterium]